MAKYFATSLAMLKVVSAPRVMSSCLPMPTISMSLVGSRVEVDHVAGLFRGLGAGVHRDADVGLGEGRGVVGAVAGHGDEPALRLLVADAGDLVLGLRLGDEVVDAGLPGDGGGGERVVAGDHDGADAHAAQLREARGDAGLDRVLEVDEAEDFAVVDDAERCSAFARDAGDAPGRTRGSRAARKRRSRRRRRP